MNESLADELHRLIEKCDDEIASLKAGGAGEDSILADLQRRRDQHYERLLALGDPG